MGNDLATQYKILTEKIRVSLYDHIFRIGGYMYDIDPNYVEIPIKPVDSSFEDGTDVVGFAPNGMVIVTDEFGNDDWVEIKNLSVLCQLKLIEELEKITCSAGYRTYVKPYIAYSKTET